MSQSELQRFSTEILTGPKLAAPFNGATSWEHLASLMRDNGYDVTDAEMLAVQDQVRAIHEGNGELPDEALDQVAGGFIEYIGLGLAIIAAGISIGSIVGGTALFAHGMANANKGS